MISILTDFKSFFRPLWGVPSIILIFIIDFLLSYFSFVSGISLLGTSTEIYVYGTQYAFILITLAISGLISWYIFLPVFCNLQLTSTYEVSCTLAESWLRLVCVCVSVPLQKVNISFKWKIVKYFGLYIYFTSLQGYAV